MLARTIEVAVTLKLIAKKELSHIIVDSTVQEKAIAHPMLAGDQRNRASWFIGLFDDFKLLLRSPAPAALNTGDHFHPVRSY